MTGGGRTRAHAALVYNPVKCDGTRLRAALAARSAEHGWPAPHFYETTIEDPGQDAARHALAEGAKVLLVAGGDGTVRAVAEAVADTSVPLAIIPSGTGNLFALNLGLPQLAPEPMIDAVFTGFHQTVDIGWARLTRNDGTADEHAFVVLAGVGLDASMISKTSPQLKKSVGWVAYVDGAARSLPGAKPFRILYQLDEARLHSAKVHSVLFANCGLLPAGISLIPDASVNDGTLDIAVIQPAGPLGWLGLWRKIWWDNSVLRRSRAGRKVLERRGTSTSIRYLRGSAAEAAVTTPTPIELDGDEFGDAIRIACRIAPGALTVVLPEGHDTSRL